MSVDPKSTLSMPRGPLDSFFRPKGLASLEIQCNKSQVPILNSAAIKSLPIYLLQRETYLDESRSTWEPGSPDKHRLQCPACPARAKSPNCSAGLESDIGMIPYVFPEVQYVRCQSS